MAEQTNRVTEDDRARLREIARLIEVDSIRDDAQRDARFLHRFAERLSSNQTDHPPEPATKSENGEINPAWRYPQPPQHPIQEERSNG